MKFLRLWKSDKLRINLQFEFRDMWIGLFWRFTESCGHLYICVVPTIPLHITWIRRDRYGFCCMCEKETYSKCHTCQRFVCNDKPCNTGNWGGWNKCKGCNDANIF